MKPARQIQTLRDDRTSPDQPLWPCHVITRMSLQTRKQRRKCGRQRAHGLAHRTIAPPACTSRPQLSLQEYFRRGAAFNKKFELFQPAPALTPGRREPEECPVTNVRLRQGFSSTRKHLGRAARVFACRVLHHARIWSAEADDTCSATRVKSNATHSASSVARH